MTHHTEDQGATPVFRRKITGRLGPDDWASSHLCFSSAFFRLLVSLLSLGTDRVDVERERTAMATLFIKHLILRVEQSYAVSFFSLTISPLKVSIVNRPLSATPIGLYGHNILAYCQWSLSANPYRSIRPQYFGILPMVSSVHAAPNKSARYLPYLDQQPGQAFLAARYLPLLSPSGVGDAQKNIKGEGGFSVPKITIICLYP